MRFEMFKKAKVERMKKEEEAKQKVIKQMVDKIIKDENKSEKEAIWQIRDDEQRELKKKDLAQKVAVEL